MNKGIQSNRILEVLWLIIFVITLAMGIFNTMKAPLKDTYMFFIMSFLSLLLYLARRNLRIKESKKTDS